MFLIFHILFIFADRGPAPLVSTQNFTPRRGRRWWPEQGFGRPPLPADPASCRRRARWAAPQLPRGGHPLWALPHLHFSTHAYALTMNLTPLFGFCRPPPLLPPHPPASVQATLRVTAEEEQQEEEEGERPQEQPGTVQRCHRGRRRWGGRGGGVYGGALCSVGIRKS